MTEIESRINKLEENLISNENYIMSLLDNKLLSIKSNHI